MIQLSKKWIYIDPRQLQKNHKPRLSLNSESIQHILSAYLLYDLPIIFPQPFVSSMTELSSEGWLSLIPDKSTESTNEEIKMLWMMNTSD
jgi:hypothetical protein